MELLRRAILVGCVLPGLWLLRLAPLDPLLTVAPVDFAARQKEEAARVVDDRKTEAERRAAELPLPVYVEEVLQYNIFPASGQQWERFLGGIDEAVRRGVPHLFFRQDDEPIRDVLGKLAAGGGTTYISISRPGGDFHYRVDARAWTRRDFRPGAGFTGKPAPPSALLYPFGLPGLGLILAGLLLFALFPSSARSATGRGLAVPELVALGAALLFFTVPLVAVGGSVQALTRGLALAIPSWALAAVGVHLFAKPGQNAPDTPVVRSLFLREGLAFLILAVGPLAFLVAASMALWNR
jgi:hypothetical protein